MGKSSKNKSTSNVIAEPWKAAQPYLEDALGDVWGVASSGGFDVTPYSGDRVAGQGPLTTEALTQFYDLGANGNPIMDSAEAAYTNFLTGDTYRDMDTLKQNVLGDVIPAVSSRFSSSGMLDSSMAADTIARSAASAIAPIEYGAWENQQNRKLGALGMAPKLTATQFLPAQSMMTAGQMQDAYSQSLIDAEMARYYEGANQPYDEQKRIADLMLAYGGLGGTQSSTSKAPSGSSTAGDIFQGIGGLGLMYAMLAN